VFHILSSLPPYAELHCLSNFSFLRGASHPQELVERAMALGYAALAITDECSVAGTVRAYSMVEAERKKAAEANRTFDFKLIIGSEFRLVDGLKLVMLATNRNGYARLCALITRGRLNSAKGNYALSRADFEGGIDDCLALLTPEANLSVADALWLNERFPGRSWIAAELHCGPDDNARLRALRVLSRSSGLPLVAAGDVHMHVRSRRRLQDVLTAIRLDKPVRRCGRALHPNGERHLRLRHRLAKLYPQEALAETLHIAAQCDFSLGELRYEYPEELVPCGETPSTHLRCLIEQGLVRRYPLGEPAKVREIIEKELDLIAEKRYEAFFLTVHDLVEFARSKSILCQGRGSAANSAVCYALGITEVDPARQQLLFERFISRERDEAPDIDVDFEHQRREEVIQYIYAKYGRDRAALAATVICYRQKSALRDVGRALDLDERQIDRLSKSLAWWERPKDLPQRLHEAGFDLDSAAVMQLVDFALALRGFPRHLSQHVGGFVISRSPLSRLVPIENAVMPGRSVIQWNKDDLEILGLLKVDVLALGMLSVIRRTLDIVNQRRNAALTMARIIEQGDDPAVYDMICKADTVGVFQIESRAQMSMLPRLKPRKFYDLVVQIAIVRPGPIQGDMVHPYLRRRDGLEPVDYPSKAVQKVLERTKGVPIFQEQVMELAVVAAGFTPGEADRLRRSMAAWQRKGGLEPYEKKLKAGMKARGYAPEFAERIYRQILGFGEYGFPESHSVSFALLAYVSAWLKHYEPAAFLASLLNSQPMGFYQPSQLLQDARRHAVQVQPVDVLYSDWECRLEGGSTAPGVRLGMSLVEGLGKAAGKRIVEACAARAFDSVADLAHRAGLDHRELRRLAAAGALRSLAGHRHQAYWSAEGVETLPNMLKGMPVDEPAAILPEPSEAQDLVADYASLGLTLGRHPLSLLRRRLTRLGFSSTAAIGRVQNRRMARTAGIVIGRQRPGTASGAIFVTLEDETGHVNVIVRDRLAEQQRRELLDARLLGVEGLLERKDEVMHLIARRLTDHSRLLGRLHSQSRDFH